MVRIRSTTLFVTLSGCCLDFNLYYVSKLATTQGIPTTISKEAQEELQKVTFDPSLMKIPDPNDLNG